MYAIYTCDINANTSCPFLDCDKRGQIERIIHRSRMDGTEAHRHTPPVTLLSIHFENSKFCLLIFVVSYIGKFTIVVCTRAVFSSRSTNVGVGGKQQTGAQSGTIFIFWARKHVPKSQRFIARPCHDRLAIWTHCQVQHAVCMASQSGHLGHGWVTPHNDLI